MLGRPQMVQFCVQFREGTDADVVGGAGKYFCTWIRPERCASKSAFMDWPFYVQHILTQVCVLAYLLPKKKKKKSVGLER